MDIYSIGRQIKLEREAAHITQEQLAYAVNCTVQHISAIERGVKTPSLEMFIMIANEIGTSADLLLADVLTSHTDVLFVLDNVESYCCFTVVCGVYQGEARTLLYAF